jgi:hypothetical protein
VGVLIACWILHTRSERLANEADALRVRQERKVAVKELVSRYHAVGDWETQLSKENRKSAILTIELERHWLSDRPVVFLGSIKDIASAEPGFYEVVVEKGSFKAYEFPTDLRLSLRAPKATIDSFLEQHPELLSSADSTTNGIAVVGKVARLSTTEYRSLDGDVVDVKTGHGDLLGIVFTGDAFYVKPKSVPEPEEEHIYP